MDLFTIFSKGISLLYLHPDIQFRELSEMLKQKPFCASLSCRWTLGKNVKLQIKTWDKQGNPQFIDTELTQTLTEAQKFGIPVCIQMSFECAVLLPAKPELQVVASEVCSCWEVL